MHHTIDDAAFFRDSRNRGPREAPVVTIVEADGTETTVTLPTVWVVCPTCQGRGTHVNPAIDCNGLSGEDFADDPEFAEAYRSGAYDQTCNTCKGRTTVPEVDYDRLTDAQRAALEAQQDAERRDYEERLAEILFGC